MTLAHTASDNELVLDELKRARGGWVDDLYARTQTIVHSRISDLRKQGHKIECKRFGPRDWRYRLVVA